jgi:ABC-type multidrug transport system fused ATPase/permease subunit
VEYLDVAPEAPAVIPDKRPPAYWPSSSGGLAVQDLEVRYAPELPAVLKKISFTVKPGEKIGVVSGTVWLFGLGCLWRVYVRIVR